MSDHCNFCLKSFKSSRAVSSHIANAPACKHRMEGVRAHIEDKEEANDEMHNMDVDGDIPFIFDYDVDVIQDMLPRSPPPNHHVHVEEVEDEERVWMQFIQIVRAEQEALGLDPWAPFADEEEWGLVKWLIARVGQMAIDEFLKLPITGHLKTSFTSKYLLMKAIDKLPCGTEWQLKRIQVKGNSGQAEGEDLELWLRNPVDCIRELMANLEFDGKVSYSPERVFADAEGTVRQYDEMWTGEWWWETQRRLPEGAVVAPFRGDQEVWPVYLTLGNISKDVRRQPSKHTAVLIAYLPVMKLECFSRETRSLECYQLFHYCVSQVLEPLISAGNDGIEVTCPDHKVRRMHPIVAAYVADFPEQYLVACCMENRCPKCTMGRNERGGMTKSGVHKQDSTLENLRLHQDGEMSNGQFEGELGLQAIYSPFWATLPHHDIFSCITPDILHQLHKGVFKDHLISWCSEIIGEEELDAHFKAMTLYSGLQHFKKGISKWKQWTGANYRELQRVFLGVIAGAVDNQILAAVCGVLDFIYYAQYQTHMDVTLSHMHNALASFHANKNIFLDLRVWEHFNIPKLHSMLHYVDAIRLFGSADGFNTELPECLHIDFTKRAYHASNRHDYVIQMTTWLQRQESIAIQEAYLRWWALQQPADSDSVTLDSDLNGPAPTAANFIILPHQAQHFTMLTASRGYFVPRRCPFPNSTIQRLLDEHSASLFIPALEDFLHNHLTPQDQIDVYKYLKVLSPARPHINIAKSPVIPLKDARKGPAPAHFDTVLVIKDEGRYTSGEGISGLRIGEVRVICDLPSRFGHLPHPLAYIHWFRPLQTFDDNLQSFKLTRSSRQQGPNAAVLPVNRVLHPCHLVPRFSRDGPEEFYLNRYIDLELFEHLS
ncbi:hypothetical protein EV424DRAFT_1472331 [Suillus variegatus]|nr:hypothetical protein EV424DRAFT_1472331 [Suillus variegatus]